MDNPNNTTSNTEYTTQWSTATPGYIIFLIDQSRSMKKKFSYDESRAKFSARAINSSIENLFISNTPGDTTKDRVFISVIGYGGEGGNSVTNIHSGYISEYADIPTSSENYIEWFINEEGMTESVTSEIPIFIEPVARGNTPIADALLYAKQLIEAWIEARRDCPAPVIINVTDGVPFSGPNSKKTEIERTINVSKEIRRLKSSDGSPLIFNVHIEKDSGQILFPVNKEELHENEMAQILYQTSSSVPDVYFPNAEQFGFKLRHGAKGFIANASPDNLIRFIKFGSTKYKV
jgi:hypothetical protein